jgi:FkbM family methyltransferase
MSIADNIRMHLAVLRACGRNLRSRRHEPEALFIPLLLQKDDICLHIGATDGRHSYMMAKALTGTGHIYAYEPSPITFPVLKRVMAIHGLKTKVTTAQKAFSNKPQRLILNIPIKKSGRRGNAFGFTSHNGERPNTRQDDQYIQSIGMLHFDVDATTIDEVVATQAHRVDFIRMDIEGSEALALEGGQKTIAKFKPHLLIEIHPRLLEKQFGGKPQDIYDAFKALGYSVYHLEQDRLVRSRNLDIAPWKDYFFLHPDRPHKLPIA